MDEIKKLVISLIRYALIAFATYLVNKGIVDQDTADKALSPLATLSFGVLVALATIGWRYLNIRFNLKAFTRALHSSPQKSKETVIEETKRSTTLATSI